MVLIFKLYKICNMNIILKKFLIVAVVFFILVTCFYRYKTSTYVTAEFKNLRPFHDKAPIYYNGFKIGKVVKVRPNKDYSATVVTMRLHPLDLKLPVNISVNLKKERNKKNEKFDYIDIIMPKEPSSNYLKNGDRITGKSSVELESYLANQDPESLDAIKEDFAETIKNLNITIQTLGDLFETLNSTVVDVKPNIVKSSFELERSAQSLTGVMGHVNSFTENVNKSLNEQRLNYTTENVEKLSENLTDMTAGLNKSIPQVQCAILETNRILCNVDEMTTGINKTLKKPFGGFRMLFGRPISK